MLLHDAPRAKYLKRMRNTRGMGALERGNLHKKIVAECKKATRCFHESCFAVNGTVKKVSSPASRAVIGRLDRCAPLLSAGRGARPGSLFARDDRRLAFF